MIIKSQNPFHQFIIFPFIFFLLTFILLSLSSCETTEPPDQNLTRPPGYQEDIPWPSLADSPWPMNHHDPQSTGRSPYDGPALGQIEWQIDTLYVTAGVTTGSCTLTQRR